HVFQQASDDCLRHASCLLEIPRSEPLTRLPLKGGDQQSAICRVLLTRALPTRRYWTAGVRAARLAVAYGTKPLIHPVLASLRLRRHAPDATFLNFTGVSERSIDHRRPIVRRLQYRHNFEV